MRETRTGICVTRENALIRPSCQALDQKSGTLLVARAVFPVRHGATFRTRPQRSGLTSSHPTHGADERKRNLLVDTLDLLVANLVEPADTSDRRAGALPAEGLIDARSTRVSGTPKSHPVGPESRLGERRKSGCFEARDN
jgi:hypothetical protein